MSHFYIILTLCVSVSEGKQRSLFALAAVHKTSCNTQQLSVQRAIANFSYYLPFKMAISGYQTLCHVRLPVSDISKLLPHSLVNRQADCGTAGQLFYSHKCCFNKQLSNKHIFTHSLISPGPIIVYWLWKRSCCLHRSSLGEQGWDAPFLGLGDKDEILFH